MKEQATQRHKSQRKSRGLLITFIAMSMVSTALTMTLEELPVKDGGCLVKPKNFTYPNTWEDPGVDLEDIPTFFTWGNVSGVNYLTQSKNQHIPFYCGSCWAQGALSALSDRINILRNASFPQIDISVQTIMDCDKISHGCWGGWAATAYKWINENDIGDETCAPYTSTSWKEHTTCDDKAVCKDCTKDGCEAKKDFNRYRIKKYGNITGEEQMIKEIYSNGPIACVVYCDPMVNFTGKGIVMERTPDAETDHIISVVGWGVDEKNGTKYWIIRNSWGEYWGDNGYARVLRGDGGAILIESHCDWAIPHDTWGPKPDSTESSESKSDGLEESLESLAELDPVSEGAQHSKYLQKELLSAAENPYALDSLPDEVIDPDTKERFRISHKANPSAGNSVKSGLRDGEDPLPKNHFWGDVNGTNYLSWTVNQNTPQYCAASWVHAALSALADRVNIQQDNFNRLTFSAQQLINCHAGGSCQGGALGAAYKFGHFHNLVEFGCQIWTARDPGPGGNCTNFNICRNCRAKNGAELQLSQQPDPEHRPNVCWFQKDHQQWRVEQYGKVRTVEGIKNEILNWGPVACGIRATERFRAYVGGIYEEEIPGVGEANHAVSIVGWGVEEATGREFWHGRNSWGTSWGENGYFRIYIEGGNLGLGQDWCYWGLATRLPRAGAKLEAYLKGVEQ